jgi:hypothetical protein
MRVIIAGGRDFNDYEILERECNTILNRPIPNEITIVSGNAIGADKLGKKYALEKKYSLEIFPADWKAYGKAAGPIRNKEMANHADMLIAFWDTKSKGTKNMIDQAKLNNLEIYVIFY